MAGFTRTPSGSYSNQGSLSRTRTAPASYGTPIQTIGAPTLGRTLSGPTAPIQTMGVPMTTMQAPMQSFTSMAAPAVEYISASPRSGSHSTCQKRVGPRPSLPVSARRSVNFNQWQTEVDTTPQGITYGENPAIFNFDMTGAHIHYCDQFGNQARAPQKDPSLGSPVYDQSSPIAAASRAPAGSTPYANRAPAGSTPYATAPSSSISFTNSPAAQFFVPGFPHPSQMLSMTGGSAPQSSIGIANQLSNPTFVSQVPTLGRTGSALVPRSSIGISPNPAFASQPPTLGRSRSEGYPASPHGPLSGRF